MVSADYIRGRMALPPHRTEMDQIDRDFAVPVGLTNSPSSSDQTSGSSSPSTPSAMDETYFLSDAERSEQAVQVQDNAEAIQQAQSIISAGTYPYYSNSAEFHDAGYETDGMTTASTTLASNARDYTYENGRRYHKFREGAYNFPNDETEQDREDMKHAMIMNLCQNLHFAPIGENPQQILDMGTGTGIWAIDMGDKYSSASVLGVDLSPIQPEWVPPNVKFMVDDVESAWLHPPNYYDYIHSRHLVMAIKDWPKLMERTYDHLKPGGWFELQEIHHFPQCHDGSMPENHPVSMFWNLISEGLGALGVNFNMTLSLADRMRDAGFVNVIERVFHVPIGMWPKNQVLKIVGMYWRTILIDGLEPIALGPLTRGLKWTPEEVEAFLVKVKKGYSDGWVHSHMPLHIVYGQKPEDIILTD